MLSSGNTTISLKTKLKDYETVSYRFNYLYNRKLISIETYIILLDEKVNTSRHRFISLPSLDWIVQSKKVSRDFQLQTERA